MFRLLGEVTQQVLVELDGAEVNMPAGVSVAAALLYLGRIPTRRSPVTGAARAPFCMMGACFDCVLEIDGVSERACQRQVEPGMRLRRQLRIDGDAE